MQFSLADFLRQSVLQPALAGYEDLNDAVREGDRCIRSLIRAAKTEIPASRDDVVVRQNIYVGVLAYNGTGSTFLVPLKDRCNFGRFDG